MKTKNVLLVLVSLSLCFSLVFMSGICAASEMYVMTEQELATLENNMNKLKQISITQKQELKTVKDTLEQSKQELASLKTELNMSKQQLTMASESLKNANESLQEFAAAEKRQRLKIKAQRNLWSAVAGVLAVVAICRR